MNANAVFLDYQIIDHLYRIEKGTYKGNHIDALVSLKELALTGKNQIWMSEITQVEMAIGHENPGISDSKRQQVIEKDKCKLNIAKELGVKWLAYPCSSLNDEYSRLGLSWRLAGREYSSAKELEVRLTNIAGVSVGDVRQIVSFVYGFEDKNESFSPVIQWFITDDSRLRTSMQKAVDAGQFPELENRYIVSSVEFFRSVKHNNDSKDCQENISRNNNKSEP